MIKDDLAALVTTAAQWAQQQGALPQLAPTDGCIR